MAHSNSRMRTREHGGSVWKHHHGRPITYHATSPAQRECTIIFLVARIIFPLIARLLRPASNTTRICSASPVNRAFLQRAVAFLSHQGVDQFLDIGSGMPTAGNVHTIAQQIHPEARIAYVDIDPIAVMHSQAILHIEQIRNTVAIQADVRQPQAILNNTEIQSLLDFTRPIGLLLAAVIHFVPDEEVALNAIRTLQDALPAGSYMALSYVSSDPFTPEEVAEAEKFYAQTTTPMRFRSSTQIGDFFAGLDLEPPGLTYASNWRPNRPEDLWHNTPERSTVIVGVGRIPTR